MRRLRNMSSEEKRRIAAVISILYTLQDLRIDISRPRSWKHWNLVQQITEKTKGPSLRSPLESASPSEGTSAMTNAVFLAECTSTWRRFPCDCETATRCRNLQFLTSQPHNNFSDVTSWQKKVAPSKIMPYQLAWAAEDLPPDPEGRQAHQDAEYPQQPDTVSHSANLPEEALSAHR